MNNTVLCKSGGIFLPQKLNLQQKNFRKIAIFLLGPPAGGKGTVAKFLHERGLIHYSSSTALSEYAEGRFPDVIEQMGRGRLVDIEHVKTVSGWHYRDFLSNNERRCAVFDGWWRVDEEVHHIANPLKVCDIDTVILHLRADRHCVEKRAKNRARFDDEYFASRWFTYEHYIEKVLGLTKKYFGENCLYELDVTNLCPNSVNSWVGNIIKLPN